MRIKPLLFILFIAVLSPIATTADAGADGKFAVYYSDKAPAARFNPYSVIVLDESYPSIRQLAERGKTLLGYISLGELEKNSPYFSSMKSKGLLKKENKNWKGSYYIDIRLPEWQKTVIEEIIPKLLRLGFSGVFIDTLDSPLEMERQNRRAYSGMSEAAIKLIYAIRLHYPSIKIMVNRAYTILPQIAPVIDMELGESVFADYNFKTKTYGKVDSALYQQQLEWLQDAKKINPSLIIYTLDYANPRDRASIMEIYRVQRTNGFTPYVATIGLEEIIDEPQNP